MMFLQFVIWCLGVVLALYVAGYLMFFDGLVSLIMSFGELINGQFDKELVVDMVWSIIKLMFASFVGWLIIFVTGMLSAMFSEF